MFFRKSERCFCKTFVIIANFLHVSQYLRHSQDTVDVLKVVLLWEIAQGDPRFIDFLNSPEVRVG